MTDKIEGDGFMVSFNPDSSQGMFGDPDGGPETALVLRDMPCAKDGHMWTGNHYLILKGNWMADYAMLVRDGQSKWGLQSFYREQREAHGSRWSTDFHEWGKDGVLRVTDTDKAPSNGET